ncbi:EAL domain-containing protein [Actinotalea sp. M2MS4P-6]|uniref:putative bifunctional diguanylate cyclase/phosphodiesterase n=1 Tax=Actinotalea sp. M2MS4P-6 TaxID=2983762 RepID=UPI0021E50925|nr:EAL domain-containing protein [Actinotalea sp. M2MS4P-6]MCV2396300.1 EAL domain-containing protein [Actinotalea sp. M2MS4P-6]
MQEGRTVALTRAVRLLAPVPWVVIVLGVIVYAFVPGGPDDPPARMTVLATLTGFFVAVVLRLALVAALEPGRRLAVLTLTGSILLWALGSATVNAEQTIESVAFPAPGEIGCVLAYVGLAAFLIVDARRGVSLSVGLEAVVVWGAAVCLSAFVLVLPVAREFTDSLLALLVAVLFPLINLMLAAVVLSQIMLRARARTLRSAMLAVGFILIAAADSSFLLSLSASGVYTTSVLLAVVWGIGFGLIAEAASRRPVDILVPRRTGSATVLLVAATLAIVVLVLAPSDAVGWIVRLPAAVTLAATGWRLTLALREARGAAEAMRLSLTDELTGLPNRRSVTAATDHAIQHHGPVSVLLLDLDSFKDINDSLGHSIGDEVLISLAERMRAVAAPGTTVARLGGDEFALVVPSEDDLELFEVAQSIRAALRQPLRVEGIDLSLDASVGIAVREDSDTSAIEMLRRADVAMYEAKQSRAGVLLFDRAQDGMSHLRLLRGEALRAAIADGQLLAWYQPQVDARTRQVVAMEALVRWWHPTEGLLPPIAFLPDARRAGLMPALTEALMLQVIKDAARWRAEGLTFRVAMNWAPPELVSGQLLPKLFTALERAGLPADSLLVEVTEDSFLADPERARMVLHELRAHGVQVAIDDYGSGFSSLAYLRDLPVQELKMDRAFVAPVASDERSRMIVQTTTQMARALGLRFVAEGVEDAIAVGELVPLGVDVLQGYHIARPMPPDAVGPWVRHWTELHLSTRLS